MNNRTRIKRILNHKEADRVPLDIGVARGCGITIPAYKKLLNYLGIKHRDIKVSKLATQLAEVDEEIYNMLGVGLRPIKLNSIVSSEIKEEKDYYWFMDEWQRCWKKPKVGGYYYDMVSFPLAEVPLNKYRWPDPANPARFQGVKEQVKYYRENRDVALVFPFGLGNGFLQMGAELYGFDRWFMMLAAESEKVNAFLDRYLEFKIKFWDALLSRIGDQLDVVCELDDLGTQKGTWISIEMYRQYIKPRQKELFSFIKKKTDAKIYLHSCGSIYDLIPDLIEVGVEILNPVQVSAAKMDTKRLKQEFGKDLVFWGGGIDTQRVLPYGSKEEVEEEVKKRIEDLAPGGGFVFATVHCIQPDVPPENVVTMLETLDKYGRY